MVRVCSLGRIASPRSRAIPMRGGNFGLSFFILHYIHRSIMYHVLQFSKGSCVTVRDYDASLNSELTTEVAAGLRLRLLLLLVLGLLTISPSASFLPSFWFSLRRSKFQYLQYHFRLHIPSREIVKCLITLQGRHGRFRVTIATRLFSSFIHLYRLLFLISIFTRCSYGCSWWTKKAH
jgi:hypothetical protein